MISAGFFHRFTLVGCYFLLLTVSYLRAILGSFDIIVKVYSIEITPWNKYSALQAPTDEAFSIGK